MVETEPSLMPSIEWGGRATLVWPEEFGGGATSALTAGSFAIRPPCLASQTWRYPIHRDSIRTIREDVTPRLKTGRSVEFGS